MDTNKQQLPKIEDGSTEKHYTKQEFASEIPSKNGGSLSIGTVDSYLSLGILPKRKDTKGVIYFLQEDINTLLYKKEHGIAYATQIARNKGKKKTAPQKKEGKITKTAAQETLPIPFTGAFPSVPQASQKTIRDEQEAPEVLIQHHSALPHVQGPIQDDSNLLLDVMAALFEYQKQHQQAMSFKKMEEADLTGYRLWSVQTPNALLHLLASPEHQQIMVLADSYVHQLEQEKLFLAQKLHEAENKLKILRSKAELRIMHDFAYPLPVMVEPQDNGGILIKSNDFHIAAFGLSEEDTFCTFIRALKGYWRQLHVHKRELSSALLKEHEQLCNLFISCSDMEE